MIPDLVFCEQHKVIKLGRRAAHALLLDVHVLGHVHFAPDDGLNLERTAFRHKFEEVGVLVGIFDRRL